MRHYEMTVLRDEIARLWGMASSLAAEDALMTRGFE